MSENWTPQRTVQLVAGTPPGGGLDRVARALAAAITQAKLLDVAVDVVNVPGDGARRCWTEFVDKHPGDAHVIDGKAELGVITAVSAVPELTAGSLRTLTLSAPVRLGGLFAQVPTLKESGVDCTVGMWRGIIAAGGIPAAATAFWNRTFAAAVETSEWQAELAKKYWANTFVAGAEEQAFLDEERAVMISALGDLGLLPQ